MEIKLAEAIVDACDQNGFKVKLQKEYSVPWKRGRKTVGVEIAGGDLTKVIASIVNNPHFFIEGKSPKFDIKNDLSVSPFRLSLILH